jgi:hypothetical protein
MKKLLPLLALGFILAKQGLPQSSSAAPPVIANIERKANYTADSVYIVSDAKFQKKGTNRWLLGDHYRKEWITPVKVALVRLDTLHGGTSVKKEGGGKQTLSLQLEADQSKKDYVIRSIEKFPSRALPPEFQNSIAAEFLKDQISSAHPFAPVVVASLAGAAGIYHTNPQMVFITHSPRLEEYDSAFGNQFYLLEERPRGKWEDAAYFGNSTNIISTEKFRDNLLNKSTPKADEAAFLRARLLDILIGDWDRHEDQWTWAQVQVDTAILYRPIPKDRDQAFANLDGVIPWIARRKWAFRRGQHFDYKIPDIKGLVWSGRNIDRFVLTALEWDDWAKEVQFVQSKWSDAAIDEAVRKLPPELYPISGEEIKSKLIRRRNDLPRYARGYYEALAEEVAWPGTAGPDQFMVTGETDTTFRIRQYSLQDGNWQPVKERTFHTDNTREVRLFGLEGDDRFQAEGSAPVKGRIRWIGGSGQNQYEDKREAKAGKPIRVYDSAIQKQSLEGDLRAKTRYDSLTHQYQYGRYDYNLLRPIILPGYNPDDGFFLGGGVDFRIHSWGHEGFAQQHLIGGNYAFKTGAFNFVYEGIFKKAIGPWDLLLQGRLNQPNYVENFYGFGNNTELPSDDKQYNRVRVKQAIARTGIERIFSEKHIVRLLAELESNRVESIDDRFVSANNPALDTIQFKRYNWVGGSASYTLTTLNQSRFPTKGVLWDINSRYLYARSENFFNQSSSFRFFLPLGKLVFGSRIGGAVLWGKPQFFQYNQLSGLENLRGYRRSRFTGKSMVYNNNELRIPITDIRTILVSGKVGLTLFCDNGRVWFPDEDSERWHWGYGGGLWIMPFGRFAFSAYYGVSKEDQQLTVKTGFLF